MNQRAPAPIDRPVFYGASAALVLVVGFAALLPATAETMFSRLLDGIVDLASWYYVLVVAVTLVACLILGLTRYGDIKLGPDHSEPEYSLVSWFAMLFAAGMGIGLMFFGVAEPVMHFMTPPIGEGGSIPAAREAMKLTFFHWGLHAWAVYAIVAVMLAYFGFRHGLPLTLRSSLYPLIGDRIYGPMGAVVDVFAILSTIFGVATSLGFGVEQINSGLNYLFEVPKTTSVQVLLIVFTTLLATVSVVLGLDVGIKRLSELNIALAVLLLLGVLILGPTVYLLQMFMQNLGAYLADIVGKTFNLYAYEPTDWLGGWTIFYWGWWISWAPFVGLFIARISRGRTLREFVLGALLGPTLFTLLWMTVFGNSAIALILNDVAPTLAGAVQEDSSVALFVFLAQFPLPGVLAGIAVLMVLVFFVTSADSGAMVLNMLSSNGRDDTPLARRIYWMAAIGLTALVLLLSGGLGALQAAAIASALPFSIAMLAGIWGFARALSVDYSKREAQRFATPSPAAAVGGNDWRERLENLLNYPERRDVQRFIEATVVPAMEEFAAELRSHGLEVRVQQSDAPASVRLDVMHGEEIDFQYRVSRRDHALPGDALVGDALAGDALEDGVLASNAAAGESRAADAPNASDREAYSRAEVYLNEGSQDYCIMGWTRSQVLNDLLEQYVRHLHFLHVLR